MCYTRRMNEKHVPVLDDLIALLTTSKRLTSTIPDERADERVEVIALIDKAIEVAAGPSSPPPPRAA